VTLIKNNFEELENIILTLREVFGSIERTTFPIEDNTIRMNFTNMSHHLFGDLILGISFKSFDKILNVC